MHWYKVITKECHVGAKTKQDQTIYLWADDIFDALDRYKQLGGVPRDKLPFFITELNSEQSLILEERIVKERKLNIDKAKQYAVRYNSLGNGLPPV